MATLEEIWSAYPLITCKQDRIGNLQIWQGSTVGAMNEAALIQNSQDIEAAFEYTNATEEDKEEISKGYTVTLRMYDECLWALFDIPF